MELMNTPMNNNISNQNENLIQSEQNRQQNINVNQYFIEKNDQSSLEYNTYVIRFIFCNVLVYSLSIMVLFGCLIPVMVIPKLDLYLKITIISAGVIFSLILMIFCVYKIKLIKDTSNGKVIVKVINHLCFPKMKLNLDIENTHFYVKREISQDEDGTHESFRLLIINDYKNLVDIDLDTSNIKQKPAKFFYSFDNVWRGKYGYTEFAQVLNNFIGSSGNYDNPLFFDINKCLNKGQKIFFFNQSLSKYMKFSDHCFTYHLKNPLGLTCVDIVFIIITIFINFCTIAGAITLLTSKNDTPIKLIGVIVFPIVNIILYILYKIFKYYFDNIFRIDCIYSKNFDRVFIGVVKYTKTKYINTFEYQMNNISRFILEKEGNLNFNLKVVLKNNETQQICTIKNKTQDSLEGLAYLLNERLNIISNNNINYNEQI